MIPGSVNMFSHPGHIHSLNGKTMSYGQEGIDNLPSFNIYLVFNLIVHKSEIEVLSSIMHLIPGLGHRIPMSSATLVVWNPPSFHIP